MSDKDSRKPYDDNSEPVEGEIVEAGYEDDDEYYDDEEEEDEISGAISSQEQARQIAEMLTSGGLMSQLSALMGGKAGREEAEFAKGQALMATGDLERAADAFLDAIELNPEYLKAYVALGQVLLAMDKEDEAITFLEKATDIDPDDAGPYLYLGYAYYAKKDFARCAEYFKVVTELEPMHHLAWNNLGYSYYLNNQLEESAKTFIKAGDIGSDRAYYNLGMIRLIQGKEKEGWQAYEDSTELDPYGNSIEDHLGDLRDAIARHPESAALLQKAEQMLVERQGEDDQYYDEEGEEEE